ncbi:charged multivesicular body protein 2A [Cryptococcus neoformans A5-35-17]|nr:charged multivesicular body protein 2A [Cryptococcus neoformans var. grubii A5-35-17]
MNILDTLFGRSTTPAERLRQHQRSLQKAQRELDREKGKLEAQEKKTMADIKRNAKAGNMNACKILAKDLVRTRRYIQKFTQMRVQLQAVSLRMQTLRSNESMAVAMKGATRAMGQMMSDAVDDAMEDEDEGEGEEAEGDKILKEVLDEIGMNMNDSLAAAPTANPLASEPLQSSRVAVAEGLPLVAPSGPPAGGASASTPGAGGPLSSEETDLQRRLDALRRD